MLRHLAILAVVAPFLFGCSSDEAVSDVRTPDGGTLDGGGGAPNGGTQNGGTGGTQNGGVGGTQNGGTGGTQNGGVGGTQNGGAQNGGVGGTQNGGAGGTQTGGTGGTAPTCNSGDHLCGQSCIPENATSCGTTCSVCPTPSNSSPSCANGACDFICDATFHKCTSECWANASVSACGTSCVPCPAPGPNQKATCAGSCGTACISTCGAGCVNVESDVSHCGACNQPCTGAEVCSLGRCVLPCNGDSGFTSVLPSVGPGVGRGAVADMNGDGKPDLVIAAEVPSRLLVHPGKGNGEFLPPISLASPGLPYFVVTGDFNKDNKVDVAVTNRNSSTVDNLLVMMGNGDGTLATPVKYALGSAALTLATADFNGDTNLDLAITTTASTAYVLLGRADGTFQAPQALALATGQLGILARDLNSDGKADLAISATSGTVGRIYVLLGKGDGTFNPAQSFLAGTHAGLLAAADFDGDAKLDLLSGDHVQGGYVRLRGNGDGSFQSPVLYTTNTVPNSELGGVGTADVNRDGKADYLMTASGVLYIGYGDGAGGLLNLGQQVSGVRGALTIADLNGDTNPDVVAVSDLSRVALGNGTGIDAPKTYGSAFTGLFADFNDDSRLDLISYGNFFAGNGDGTFGTGVNIGLASELAAADVNGDAKLDLLSRGSIAGAVGVRRGNGNGTFQTLEDVPIGVSPSSIAVADLNGDGKKDIALTQTGANGLAAIALGNGDGTFQSAVTVFAFSTASMVVTADFNHDGSADLAVSQDEFSGRVAFLLNNGNVTFQTSFTSTIQYPRQLSVGDLNGDGHADVLITSSSQISRFHVAYGDGAGAFTLTLFDGYPNRGPNAIGDFNGDGKMDFAITSDATGAPSHLFWGTGGGGFAYEPYTLGTGISTNPAMLAGDLNGDGRTDLRVASFVLLGGCR